MGKQRICFRSFLLFFVASLGLSSIPILEALASSRTETIGYHDNLAKWVLGQVSAKTIDGVVVEQTSYDANTATPLQAWSFGKLKQTLSYNANGTVATIADGNGNIISLSSWKRGVPQSINFADGTTQSATVNESGWIVQVVDQAGFGTNYSYDTMGRLSSTTYPANDSVAWNVEQRSFTRSAVPEYGLAPGFWRQVITSGNLKKIVYYDALWRPVITQEEDISNSSGTRRQSRVNYDLRGRKEYESYPINPFLSGEQDFNAPLPGVWTDYDPLGRVTAVAQDSEQGLLITTTTYLSDALGAYTLLTNPRGGQTRTWYQMFGVPSYETPTKVMQAEGVQTTISRDVFGKPTSIVRGNSDWSTQATRVYRYNNHQELCASVEPETGATLMGYDAAGNLTWSAAGLPATTVCENNGSSGVVAARRVTRTYNNRNRLTALTFPDGNGNQTWTYTPDGKPNQIITADLASSTQAINTYTYNKRRLLTAETAGQAGGYNWLLGYGYDANGVIAGVQYPSGMYVNYAPNALGQPTQAGNYAVGVAYYPNGAMSQFVYGNGITHTLQQNGRQLPMRVKDGVVLDTTYSYDANGNVAQIADALDSNRTRAMAYDGLDRLVQATSPSFGGGGQVNYSYNALDNLLTTKLAGVKQYNYWYDTANRLSNIMNDGGATIIGFAYDVQGNLANKNGQIFQFDYGNRLRNAVGKETYRYDGHGRRVVSWSASQGNIISMYGQDGVLRRQDNDRKGEVSEYVHLNGSLLAKVTTSTAPAVPVVTATSYSDNGSYTVSWSAIQSTTSYELQEQFEGGSWQGVYAGSSLSWSATGKSGGTYGYRARACRGAICGGWSGAVNVSVQSPPAGAPTLSAPSSSATGNYSLSWNQVSGATTYKLEERANGGAWTQVENVAGTSKTFSGKPDGSYAYRIAACNAAGCGGFGVIITVPVQRPPGTSPILSAPGLSSNGSYSVSWAVVTGAATYQLEESANGAAWVNVPNVSGTSVGFGGKADGSYSYRAKACNTGGCSPTGNIVVVTVLRPPSAVPTVNVPGTSENGDYVVGWTSVASASSYRLEESVNGGGWSHLQTTADTTKSFVGKDGGTYSYRVAACNISGCGGFGSAAAVSVSGIPAVPTMLKSHKTQSRVNGVTRIYTEASWTAVQHATRYELVNTNTGGIQYSGPNTSVGAASTAYGAPSHIVRACNARGCSPYSSPPFVQTFENLGNVYD